MNGMMGIGSSGMNGLIGLIGMTGMTGPVLEASWELMGAVALGFFWIHTLLIAGAAWLDLRGLGRLAARTGPGKLEDGAAGSWRVEVRDGKSPDGVFAVNVVEQVGRSKGDGVVWFSDVAHRSDVFGGTVALAGERVEVSGGPRDAVWPAPGDRERAAQPSDDAAIEAALPAAKRARGFTRTVTVPIAAGPLWIAGTLVRDGETWRLEGDRIVAAEDPKRWVARRRWLVAAFIVAEVGLAAACTLIAIWPPLFGTVSLVGAALCLGFFLAVQPIGVALTDAVRTPDRAYLRGSWRVERG